MRTPLTSSGTVFAWHGLRFALELVELCAMHARARMLRLRVALAARDSGMGVGWAWLSVATLATTESKFESAGAASLRLAQHSLHGWLYFMPKGHSTAHPNHPHSL